MYGVKINKWYYKNKNNNEWHTMVLKQACYKERDVYVKGPSAEIAFSFIVYCKINTSAHSIYYNKHKKSAKFN